MIANVAGFATALLPEWTAANATAASGAITIVPATAAITDAPQPPFGDVLAAALPMTNVSVRPPSKPLQAVPDAKTALDAISTNIRSRQTAPLLNPDTAAPAAPAPAVSSRRSAASKRQMLIPKLLPATALVDGQPILPTPVQVPIPVPPDRSGSAAPLEAKHDPAKLAGAPVIFTAEAPAGASTASGEGQLTPATAGAVINQTRVEAGTLPAAPASDPVISLPQLVADRSVSPPIEALLSSPGQSQRSSARSIGAHTAASTFADRLQPPTEAADTATPLSMLAGTSPATLPLPGSTGQAAAGSPQRPAGEADLLFNDGPDTSGEPGFSIDSRLLGPVSAALLPLTAASDRLHVRFTVDRPATAALISSGSDRLEQALSATGMRLGSLAVEVGLLETAPHAPLPMSSTSSDTAMPWAASSSALYDGAPSSGARQPVPEPRTSAARIRPVHPPTAAAITRDRFA